MDGYMSGLADLRNSLSKRRFTLYTFQEQTRICGSVSKICSLKSKKRKQKSFLNKSEHRFAIQANENASASNCHWSQWENCCQI